MPDFSLIKIATSPNWYVQWFEAGRSRRVSTRTPDSEEAALFLSAFRLEAAGEPSEDVTVAQVLEWYWDSHGKTTMRPDNVDLAIRNLRPYLGGVIASACNVARQQAYVDYKRDQRDERGKRSYGDESIRRDLSTLSAALRRAAKHSKIAHAPAALTLTPSAPRERWLTRKEAARLLRSMRGRRQRHVLLFTRLALYTGARTGAILDLTWDRVDFDTGLIDFHVPGRPLTKKRRTIAPMTRKIRRMLAHAKKHSRSRHVVSWAGERIDRVAKAVNANAEKAGIKGFSPHVLRHTFASWAVQRRVSIYTVGKALGQTVASTTERYAKLAPDDVLEAMERSQRK